MNQPGIPKSIEDIEILALGNDALIALHEQEKAFLASAPVEVRDAYLDQKRDIQRRLRNKLLYGVEEIQ